MRSSRGGPRRGRIIALTAILGCAAASPATRASAEEVTLKDGTLLRGAIDTPAELRGFGHEGQPGFIRVDDGLTRRFFHTKQLAHTAPSPPLSGLKPFRISQPIGPRSQTQVIDNLVTIVDITPWDQNGRR